MKNALIALTNIAYVIWIFWVVGSGNAFWTWVLIALNGTIIIGAAFVQKRHSYYNLYSERNQTTKR